METIARKLQSKITAAHNILRCLFSYELPGMADMESLINRLRDIDIESSLKSSHLHVEAYGSFAGKMHATVELRRLIASENYHDMIDKIVLEAMRILRREGYSFRIVFEQFLPTNEPVGRGKKKRRVCADTQRSMDVYPVGDYVGNEEVYSVDYESCPSCGLGMVVDSHRSELRCPDSDCGIIRELIGGAIEDPQFCCQDGQKSKSGSFNPNRHFQFWWCHILAREPEDEIGDKSDPDNLYGEKVLDELRRIIKRDNKLLRLLTVNDVREMLKEIDKTHLNKNVPLIMKKLTGIGPPSLSDAIAVKVENLFTKTVDIGERVRRACRINRNYYPFYIYKILDQILPVDDHKSRRVIYYIYIQSKETVESDDADWEHICAELPELEYYPTDRNAWMKYAPL